VDLSRNIVLWSSFFQELSLESGWVPEFLQHTWSRRPTYKLTNRRSTTASPPRSGVCATKLYRSRLAAPFSGSRFFRLGSWRIDGRPRRLLVYRLSSYTDPATLHLLFSHGDRSRPVSWQRDEPRPQNPPPSGLCATKLRRSGEAALPFQRRDRAAAPANWRRDERRPQTPSPFGVCATNVDYAFFFCIEIERSPASKRRDEPRSQIPPPSGVARYQATSIQPAHSAAPGRSPCCTTLFAFLHPRRYLVKEGGACGQLCHLSSVPNCTLRTSSLLHRVSQRVIRPTLPQYRKP